MWKYDKPVTDLLVIKSLAKELGEDVLKSAGVDIEQLEKSVIGEVDLEKSKNLMKDVAEEPEKADVEEMKKDTKKANGGDEEDEEDEEDEKEKKKEK